MTRLKLDDPPMCEASLRNGEPCFNLAVWSKPWIYGGEITYVCSLHKED